MTLVPGGGALAPEALCALLTPADWQQFNYVTGAQPDVTSDAPGTALCQYASTLTFEVYVDETAEDAAETFQTILENAPFEGAEEVTLAGADEAQIDMQITDETSGIAVRAGRVTFTIGGPAREEAQEQLKTLAETVLGRISALR